MAEPTSQTRHPFEGYDQTAGDQGVKAAIKAFEKQFASIDGGYLYYPSKRSGGRFVTQDEYDVLIRGFAKILSNRGLIKRMMIPFIVIHLWIWLYYFLNIPNWTSYIFPIIGGLGVSIWLVWPCLAPLRLVKNRPAIAPPRTQAEFQDLQQVGLAAFSWWLVGFILIFSGGACVVSARAADGSLHSWLWIGGSATLFALNFWLAIRKLSAAKLG